MNFSKIVVLALIVVALAGCGMRTNYGTPNDFGSPVVAAAAVPEEAADEHALISERGHEPQVVTFDDRFEYGTIIVKTAEKALYRSNGDGTAVRFPIAVGKEGFAWSGEAHVGLVKSNPTWTPPSEMIDRKPELAKWQEGMPGGIPENPLGTRALYLYDEDGHDTLYRIHGTNAPESIGTAASSGCIRMYNSHVEWLAARVSRGTKVIVVESDELLAMID